MSEAREQILSTIRRSLGRGRLTPQAETALEARMITPARHTRPQFDEDLTSRFIAKLVSHAGTVARVGSMDDVPAAVVAYAAELGIAPRIVVTPALAGLAWPADFSVRQGRARKDDLLSVTPCLAGVAETGTLVLVSGVETPTTLNFVPEYQAVILRAEQMVRHYEDAWARVRALPDGMPRAVNFISGPSRTADIEQTIALGAHGPRRLHVVLVGR